MVNRLSALKSIIASICMAAARAWASLVGLVLPSCGLVLLSFCVIISWCANLFLVQILALRWFCMLGFCGILHFLGGNSTPYVGLIKAKVVNKFTI